LSPSPASSRAACSRHRLQELRIRADVSRHRSAVESISAFRRATVEPVGCVQKVLQCRWQRRQVKPEPNDGVSPRAGTLDFAKYVRGCHGVFGRNHYRDLGRIDSAHDRIGTELARHDIPRSNPTRKPRRLRRRKNRFRDARVLRGLADTYRSLAAGCRHLTFACGRYRRGRAQVEQPPQGCAMRCAAGTLPQRRSTAPDAA